MCSLACSSGHRRRLLRSSARSTAAARGVQNQLLTDTLAGIDVIHGFNAGKPVMESLRGSLQQTSQAARSTGSWTAVRATLTQLVIWGSLLTLFVLLGSAGEFGTRCSAVLRPGPVL